MMCTVRSQPNHGAVAVPFTDDVEAALIGRKAMEGTGKGDPEVGALRGELGSGMVVGIVYLRCGKQRRKQQEQ